MNLAWCMIALALTGTDDPTSTKTAPGSALSIGAPAAHSTLSNICQSTCGDATVPLAKQIEPAAKEIWPMTLRQAITMALDNSDFVRVIVFGKQSIPIGSFLGPTKSEKDRPERQRTRPSSR